ncbi:MAG: acetate--CoA ligase family protein [Crenarchaeota archaeon]|nr:acetate--CoA ligase family protein [Thermoproteota archaeon]
MSPCRRRRKRFSSLNCLIHPRSVALIGASSNRFKIGGIMWSHLQSFPGRKYPVNIKQETMGGVKAYARVKDIPEKIDLAVIAVPAKSVPSVIDDCIEKRVKAVIVISGGFSETGEEGRKLENEIKSKILNTEMVLLGPNTLGVYVPRERLDTMFVLRDKSRRPPDGPIAFISQSGASASGFMDMAESHGYGISAFVGLGNKLDVNENDMLELFSKDSKTRVICIHIECFAEGKRFLQLCRKITISKPVVVLKAGRTEAGARAAMLHTGSMAKPSLAMEGAFKQAGIIRANDLLELFDYSRILAYQQPMFGPNIVVVTSGGGYGVIAADYIEDQNVGGGLRLAEISPDSKRKLMARLPSFASVDNPVDLTGNVTDEMFDYVFKVVNEDENTDGILAFPLLQTPYTTDNLVEIVWRWFKNGRKPMVPCIIGGLHSEEVIRRLESRGMPVFPDIRRAVISLRVLYERGRYLMRMRNKTGDAR